jgi:hypothetical protein
MITPSFSPTATERVLPKLALDFTTASLDSRITFTRALNTATVINSSGQIAPINANLPRFDYNLGTGGSCKGLLIEESRINLFNNSLLAGVAAGSPGTAATNWTIAFGTGATTALATSIYGTLDSAQAVTFSGTAVRMMYSQNINVTSGQQYALSAYMESATGAIGDFLYAVNGTATVTMNSFVTSPTQPGRYTVLFTANGTGTCGIRIGIGASGGTSGSVAVTFSRPQVEAGSFSTSYIPTTTSGSTTRNADVATMTGTNFSSWFNATEGAFETVSVLPYTIPSGQFPCLLQIAGTAGNTQSIYQFLSAGNNRFSYDGTASSAAQWSVGAASNTFNVAANITAKYCGAYKANSIAGAVNGVNPVTDATATIPTVTSATIGSVGGTSQFWNGYVQKIYYWPQRLINNEVQAFSK